MADGPSPEELEVRLEELTETVEELREQLQPRGPFGLPRPPTPGELAGFTAEYTLPAAIAGLEAAVRSLELLQAALRATAPADRGEGQAGDGRRTRARRAGDAVLEEVDAALADLRAALEATDTPPNQAARDLLEETRRLNEEARAALEADGEQAEESESTNGAAETDTPSPDIEDEIETIRRELDDGAENGDG